LKTGLSVQKIRDYEPPTWKKDPTKDRLFLQLVACDDWSTIASWALPYIAEYGAAAVKYLYDRYAAKPS